MTHSTSNTFSNVLLICRIFLKNTTKFMLYINHESIVHHIKKNIFSDRRSSLNYILVLNAKYNYLNTLKIIKFSNTFHIVKHL